MNKNIITLILGCSQLFGFCYGQAVLNDLYVNPGVVANKNGEWIGSDHLLNLGNNIEVSVEIVKPEKSEITVSGQDIEAKIRQAFSAAGITPSADIAKNKAPLPLFHVLIMIFPYGEQVVAFISCRLLESVTINRGKIDPSTVFQAITWDNQNMMISSKKDFPTELDKNVRASIETFLERYQFFKGFRS